MKMNGEDIMLVDKGEKQGERNMGRSHTNSVEKRKEIETEQDSYF